MKVSAAVAILAFSSRANAFAPSAPKASVSRTNVDGVCGEATCLSMNKVPFFAQEEEKAAVPKAAAAQVAAAKAKAAAATPSSPAPPVASAPSVPADFDTEDATILEARKDAAKQAAIDAELNQLTVEEEVELLVRKEMGKTKRMSNLRNEKGVEYAPWMGISAAEEDKIRALVRDRTEARRRRQEEARDVTGNLFRDSQAQEISGTGLSYKIIDGAVELQWATRRENDTRGFIVKRRKAKTNDYEVVASYADYGPLQSKGKDGGIYRYLDETAAPGGWVYRVSEEDNLGNQADICQCLVEVETEDEQRGAVIAAVGFGVFAVGAVVAGLVIDPIQ